MVRQDLGFPGSATRRHFLDCFDSLRRVGGLSGVERAQVEVRMYTPILSLIPSVKYLVNLL